MLPSCEFTGEVCSRDGGADFSGLGALSFQVSLLFETAGGRLKNDGSGCCDRAGFLKSNVSDDPYAAALLCTCDRLKFESAPPLLSEELCDRCIVLQRCSYGNPLATI